MVLFIVMWFAFGKIATGVDNAIHVAGFIGGVITALITLARDTFYLARLATAIREPEACLRRRDSLPETCTGARTVPSIATCTVLAHASCPNR